MKHRIMICLTAALAGSLLSACGGGEDGALSVQGRSLQKMGSPAAPALSTSSPPGSNFNLAPFTLQLPTGSSGSITTVSGTKLAAGYTNPTYFYTDSSDGSMVMMDPTQGWTT